MFINKQRLIHITCKNCIQKSAYKPYSSSQYSKIYTADVGNSYTIFIIILYGTERGFKLVQRGHRYRFNVLPQEISQIGTIFSTSCSLYPDLYVYHLHFHEQILIYENLKRCFNTLLFPSSLIKKVVYTLVCIFHSLFLHKISQKNITLLSI